MSRPKQLASTSEWATVLGVAYSTLSTKLTKSGMKKEGIYYPFEESKRFLACVRQIGNGYLLSPEQIRSLTWTEFQERCGKKVKVIRKTPKQDSLLIKVPAPSTSPSLDGPEDVDKELDMGMGRTVNQTSSIWEMIGLEDCQDEEGNIDWNIAKTKAQAYRQAMAAARERGELVDRDLVLRFFAAEFGAISSAQNLLPARLAPRLAAIAQSSRGKKDLVTEMSRCVKEGVNSLVETIQAELPLVAGKLETAVQAARDAQGGK